MGFLKRLFGGDGEQRRPDRQAGVAFADSADADDDVGIFAGVFVASPEALDSWDAQSGLTPPEWPAMEFKGLESVKLGTLESILTGVDYDDIDQDDLHELARDEGSEGPWVWAVRQELASALAGLDEGRIETTAAAWADSDEFKVDPSDKPSRADIEDLAGALGEMASLAREANQRGERMYVLASL